MILRVSLAENGGRGWEGLLGVSGVFGCGKGSWYGDGYLDVT